MTARLFFIFTLVSIPKLSGAKVFIKLDVQDCAKCSMVLSELSEASLFENVFVVVPQSYAAEEVIMKRELGLDKFTNFTYRFSDSLFQFFQTVGRAHGSEVLIIREGKVVFVSPLELGYLNKILFNIKLDKMATICPAPVLSKYLEGVSQFGHHVISQDRYNNVFVFDLLINKYHEIRMDKKENLEFLYKGLYREHFNERYPIMKKIIEETPKFKPSIYWGSVLIKGEKIVMSYLPWDFNVEGGDSSVSVTSMILVYDLKKEKFISAYNKDLKCAFADKDLMKVVRLKNQLYGKFSTSNGPMFYALALDSKRQVFTARGDALQHIYPQNYFKSTINEGTGNLLTTSNYTILMRRGDSIYSAFHDKLIRIPYPADVLADLSKLHNGFTYFNPKEGVFAILYKYDIKNTVYYLSFNEKGERIDLRGFIGFDSGSFEIINPYELLLIDNKTHCFSRKSLLHGNILK